MYNTVLLPHISSNTYLPVMEKRKRPSMPGTPKVSYLPLNDSIMFSTATLHIYDSYHHYDQDDFSSECSSHFSFYSKGTVIESQAQQLSDSIHCFDSTEKSVPSRLEYQKKGWKIY